MITAIKLGLVALGLFALAYVVEIGAILLWSHPAAGRRAMSTPPRFHPLERKQLGPNGAEPIANHDWYDPFGGFDWEGWTP
jgi:hypothetical protein